MLLGKRVITPDYEQGFISDEYSDDTIDVEILEDDAETPEHTTTINFDLSALTIPDDQMPFLNDITPFGRVVAIEYLADGIIGARLDNGYDGIDSSLWLSDEHFKDCPDYIEQLFGNWTSPLFYPKLLTHFRIRKTELGNLTE